MTDEPSIVTRMRMSMEVKSTAYCNYRVLIAETGEGGEGDLQLTVFDEGRYHMPVILTTDRIGCEGHISTAIAA